MIHSYDVEIAEKHGMVCAVLLYNIYHWIEKNKETDINFHDGRYWTYDTTETLAKHFPEMSKRTIQRAMKKLEDENLIVKGNFNKSGFDKTTWYTLTDLAYSIMTICHHPLRQNGVMDNDKMAKPIPQCTTADTQRTEKEIDKSISMSDSESLTEKIHSVLEAWNAMASKTGVRPVVRLTQSSTRYKLLRARIVEYGLQDVLSAIENIPCSPWLLGDNKYGWMIDFEWFVRPNSFTKVFEGKYGKASSSESTDDDFYRGEG